MTEHIEKVSKLEAAARQLREAILLFFERRDTIAIHSLAAASHQILVDLASHCGLVSILKNNPLLRPEKKKEWIALMNNHHNFFKHADRDSSAVIEFRPAMTEFFLFDAVQLYAQLTSDLPLEQNVFLAWFNATYTDLMVDGPIKEAVTTALEAGLDPSDFPLLLTVAKGKVEKL